MIRTFDFNFVGTAFDKRLKQLSSTVNNTPSTATSPKMAKKIASENIQPE